MAHTFRMKIADIQPSQLFINAAKLSRVMETFDPARPETLQPIPVKKLGGQIIFTDGHTRALAAFLSGLVEIQVFWDEDELDWEAYAICVQWCREEGIHTIADLANRIILSEEYERLWIGHCRAMQQALEKKRGNATSNESTTKTAGRLTPSQR